MRIGEVAAELMQQHYGSPAVYAVPAGVNATQWNTFITAAGNAAGLLRQLKTGLPDASGEDPNVCGHSSHANENLSQIPNDRIMDMNFLPVQGGNVIGGSPVKGGRGDGCSEVPLCTTNGPCAPSTSASFLCANTSADSNLLLGRVLGWQGASADDHEEDTQLWMRPTSSVAFNLLADLALSGPYAAVLATGGAAVVFFTCLWDLIKGDSCLSAIGSISNLINDVSPTGILGNAFNLPGIDTPGDTYDQVGVWHFEDAAQFSGKTDAWNPGNESSIRGILYDEAGPNGSSGTIDTLLSAVLGDALVGMSLDVSKSAGVQKYGQYDQIKRDSSYWQNPTIGHIEFSPIDNLAQYGWAAFTATPNTALPLSYPLHALGDAAEPQHAAGTTSYGHRPYEDAVDDLLDSKLLPPPTSCALAANGYYDSASVGPIDSQAERILLAAFNDWTKYIVPGGTVPFRKMIQDLAVQTYATSQANPNVFQDALSNQYQFETTLADVTAAISAAGCVTGTALEACPAAVGLLAAKVDGEQLAIKAYEDPSLNIQGTMATFLEQSTAMTLAFLIGAAAVEQAGGVGPNNCQYTSSSMCGVVPLPTVESFTPVAVCIGASCTDAGSGSIPR